MSWQVSLLLLLSLLAGFCLVWIIVVEANQRDVIRDKPWNDPRSARHRNYTTSGDLK